MDALQLALGLGVAGVVTALATPLVGRLAVALQVVDRPSDRGVSRRDRMPLLGGLAVATGFGAGLVAILTAFGDSPADAERLWGVGLGAALILMVGVLDDRYGLKAAPKLCVEIAAAVIAISYGFKIFGVGDPINVKFMLFPEWLAWSVSILWIVGVTNAVNLLDGLDGLAAGVATIIGATLGVIAWQAGQPITICLGVVLVGALLGFLPFNFPPARIFLGDTGALFVGFILALMAIDSYRRVSLLTFVVPLLALAVPILDTLLSIVRRVRRREAIFSADRSHMHHKLLAFEGSERSTVLQFYFITLAFSLIAVSFTRLEGSVAALCLALTVILTVRMLRNLGLLAVDRDDLDGQVGSALEEKET